MPSAASPGRRMKRTPEPDADGALAYEQIDAIGDRRFLVRRCSSMGATLLDVQPSAPTAERRVVVLPVPSRGPGPCATLSARAGLLSLLVATPAAARATGTVRGAVVDGFGNATLIALCNERDLFRFPPSRVLKRLRAVQNWLDRPNVEVQRYVEKFLHGKAYLFGDPIDARAALATSGNLTAAGLWQNLELRLVHYDP